MNKFSIKTLFIILAVSLVLGGCWLKGVEEADTSGWQTYRNERYGFEVKYPSDWIILEETMGSIIFMDEKEAETLRQKQAGEIRCLVAISFYNNEKGWSLYDWAIEKWGEPENREAGRISKIKIDNLKGIKYEFMSMGIQTNILFSKNNKVIEIYTTFDGCNGLNAIFSQMLSTFKFLD